MNSSVFISDQDQVSAYICILDTVSRLTWSELVLVLQVIIVCVYVVFSGTPATQQSQTTEYKPSGQSETRQSRPARRRSRSATPTLQTPERERTGECAVLGSMCDDYDLTFPCCW